jgi:alkylation response protein AidB-like acyl-CoA dehydrogenase
MNFDLDQQQTAILDAMAALLQRHAGPARAIALAADGEYDDGLDAALDEAGFSAIVGSGGSGTLEATLLVEAVARAAGTVAFAAGALVAPAVLGGSVPGPIALAVAGRSAPIRYACQARTVLVLDAERVRVVDGQGLEVERVATSFGYPMGRFVTGALDGGRALGAGSGVGLQGWWRVAVAAEAVGSMRAALEVTTEYVKHRRQFGRPIGSFQAVQHRLAECAVLVEGCRWLTYEAAWRGAPAEAASVAAAHALQVAGRVFAETHQLSGAIGFTCEHDLHVWTMRLQALRLELDGVAADRRAVADARWQNATGESRWA